MKIKLPFLAAAAATLGSMLLLAFGLRAGEATVAERASEHGLLVERGQYLVNHVGLCADCHTPRNDRGEYITQLWLEGAALPFKPTVPMPWKEAAPPIAGLRSMNDQQAIVFLTTGVRPDGTRPLPPMPPFRFSEADAQAVLAYLRTVGK